MDGVGNCQFRGVLPIWIIVERGAVVEWLERCGYGADSRRKIVSSRLGFAI